MAVCSRWMPCTVKKTFEIAHETGNQVLVQVKGNQPELLKAVERIAEEDTPCAPTYSSFEHDARSRMESRKVTVFAPQPAALPSPWEKHVQAVIQVKRSTEIFQTKTGTWKKRQETAFYVADHHASPADFSAAIRGHWAIENRLHYVRDVTLGEDASRIRRNPGIFARLRTFALNILRKNNVTNVAAALYENALDFNRILKYQGVC